MTSELVEPVDFRSKKMPTRDGYGMASSLAGAARIESLWDGIETGARRAALQVVMDRVGFWLVWKLEGGFDGLRRLGYSDATIYRKIKGFRESFGAHPDDYSFPGVSVDVGEYARAIRSDDVRVPLVIKNAVNGPARLRGHTG